MRGIKTKTGKEKGDIVKAVGTITLYELPLKDYDTIYPTEIVGFYTGTVKRIDGSNYDEVVLTIALNSDESPDFSQPKYYFLEGMPVSFVANPDYDYASGSIVDTTSKKSFDWLGSINNVISTIGGILGLIKKKDKTVTDTGSDSSEIATDSKNEEQSWLQRNMIYVISFVGIVLTGGIIFYLFNKSEKKKAQIVNKQLT